jgi:hypothetical protein
MSTALPARNILDGSAAPITSSMKATMGQLRDYIAEATAQVAVASAATLDVFGAAGAVLNVSGIITVTGITACTAAQVGSIKTIIPSNAAGFSITATANIVVDGAASGTYLMPMNANIQIIATSTTTFKITTIFASGTWTPTDSSGAGLSLALVECKYTKIGSQTTVFGRVTYPANANGTQASITLPFVATSFCGAGVLCNLAGGVMLYIGSTAISASIFTTASGAITNATLSGKELDISFTYKT